MYIAWAMKRERYVVRKHRRRLKLGPPLGKRGGTRTQQHRERISEGLRQFWQTRPDREQAITRYTAYLTKGGARDNPFRLPPRGTPEYRQYRKISDVLGARAARAIMEIP